MGVRRTHMDIKSSSTQVSSKPVKMETPIKKDNILPLGSPSYAQRICNFSISSTNAKACKALIVIKRRSKRRKKI
jgi:hypothetical protein